MKKILSVALALALTLCAATALADGTFRVGMECDYAPFNWTQTEPSDTAVAIEGGMGYADGYDVQIAKQIAQALGKELVIVKTEWNGLAPGATTGLFDAIIAGMSPTEERKATLDFTDAYYVSDLVIVVRKDSPYANATSLADFDGAVVVGQLNTFHDTVIDQIPNVVHATPMDSFPAMIVALTSGTVDGYVSEDPGAKSAVLANPDLAYVAFEADKGFAASENDRSIAIALNKGSDLVAPINDFLATLSPEARVQMMNDAISRQPLAQ